MEDALRVVCEEMPPTPQQRWPLPDERLGGLVYIKALRRRAPEVCGVISATRGNHGQSIGMRRGGSVAKRDEAKHCCEVEADQNASEE